MKRPKQLPAVDRNSNKSAAIPVGANVGPSAWYDTLLQHAPDIIRGAGTIGSWF